MLSKITSKEDLKRIEPLFTDIRFYMGKSVLEGIMGEVYTDNALSPKFAILLVKSFCFISGIIEKEELREIINNNFKNKSIIPSDEICVQIEEIYGERIVKTQRYSIKKNPSFNISKLKKMTNNLSQEYKIEKIKDDLIDKVREEGFNITTENYEKNGIGFCCIYNNEIIGSASSNIFYKDGIEVNVRVKEKYRRKGIATAMCANLILECINQNKKISWDAKDMNSVKLAEKLGFEYDSPYNRYKFKKSQE
ncbi:MAG: GNAT family N-acetyltransferase [Clostridia bacterium]|nr:GNAT family N-acetyltransferase [Bacilli bacterium]MBR3324892.1 GNAT family N-acetyltransferase [Clostridia bacterium]MBR4618721.1 GNAT family N-acetyltransferase [Bacilli bacterium]